MKLALKTTLLNSIHEKMITWISGLHDFNWSYVALLLYNEC